MRITELIRLAVELFTRLRRVIHEFCNISTSTAFKGILKLFDLKSAGFKLGAEILYLVLMHLNDFLHIAVAILEIFQGGIELMDIIFETFGVLSLFLNISLRFRQFLERFAELARFRVQLNLEVRNRRFCIGGGNTL